MEQFYFSKHFGLLIVWLYLCEIKGHARYTGEDWMDSLVYKFKMLSTLAMNNPEPVIEKFQTIERASASDMERFYDFEVEDRKTYEI